MSETPDVDPRAARPRDVEEEHEPVVRDKRRIDPVTGQIRQPPAGATPPAASPGPASPVDGLEPEDGGEQAAADVRVAELTADLQRVSAEYANYRRRVERDREAMTVNAAAVVVQGLLPVLDDIARARAHGDLEGSFRSVGEAVEKVTTTLGVSPFGEAGEPFDPTVHEALVSQPSSEVTEPTVAEVYAAGYRLGDRLLRPAQVVVAEPG